MATKLEEERIEAEARRRKLEAELERMLGILRGLEDVELVIAFGSYARGQVGLESDLDLIVVRRDPRRFFDRLGALYELLSPRVGLDLLVYTPEEFAELSRARPFVMEAVREGRVLLDRRRVA